MNKNLSPLRTTGLVLSASTLLLLAGCGLGSPTVASDAVNVSFAGNVHGGQQPVTGSHIALFATSSSTGYGGTLTPLATTTTDSSGNFRINSAYTCPAGQQAYLVATGGNPGLQTAADNSAIFMVAALGPCSGVNASTYIVVNELTTVAAAYALSGFAPAGGAGMTEAAVISGSNVAGVTTSATNVQGLTDAFANAISLVSTANGQANSTTAGGNGTIPVSALNSLADILQDCVNSALPTSTNCSSLFTAATPPAASGVAAPANIFQAALDIAQYPGNNVATLFGLISPQSAFAPTLATAPNDWTVGVAYTSPLLISGSGLGIDANDNVYVSGTGYLINFTPQGAPISTTNLVPTIPATDTLRQIAFDLTGNLFVSDGAYTGIYEYKPSNATVTALNYSTAPASATNANTYSIAVDGQGDVFTSSYSKATCSTVGCNLVEFPATANASPAYPAYAPFSTFNGFTAPQPTGALGGARGIAFDVKTGNVWITAIDDNLGSLFTLTPGTGVATATAAPKQLTGFGSEAGVPATNTAYGTISVAVDSTSRAWFVVAGGPAVTTSGKATPAIPGALYPVSATGTVGTGITGGGLVTPTTVAIDGNNNLFVANTGGSSVVQYSPAQAAFLSPITGFAPSSTGVLYQPSYLAIDRSGAVWTLSSGNGTTHPANLIQILGVAAPVNPVLAAGKYGVKP